MEEDAKRKLKTADLQAKKDRLRIWTNYVPPASNSKAIHDQNFTGKVKWLILVSYVKSVNNLFLPVNLSSISVITIYLLLFLCHFRW